MSRFSRRQLLVGAAGTVGAGAAAAAGLVNVTGASSSSAAASDDRVVPFRGAHQAGIVTPAQDRLYFASFDVITSDRQELIDLLAAWTTAAEQMTQGLETGPTGATGGAYLAPPDDTGEALGLGAASLTITFGFGATLFTDADGVDRFGIADRRPSALIDLPHFAGDQLDPTRSDGDLCIQACSDDPQVAFHAVRNLARLGFGVVGLRWSQLGFGRTSSTSTSQTTPRNLFGFKDGTSNVTAEATDDLAEHVWVTANGDAEWMTDGTYLVARRIDMQIETWDRTSLAEQETVIGRTKESGAPLSGGTEFSEPDFAMPGSNDDFVISARAHVRLAHPSAHGGAKMLRRGYNFTDGSTRLGGLDAGLFFIAFVADPARQFVPVQELLSAADGLMEYLQHTGSALFAIPPGTQPGQSIGHTLFA